VAVVAEWWIGAMPGMCQARDRAWHGLGAQSRAGRFTQTRIRSMGESGSGRAHRPELEWALPMRVVGPGRLG